MGIDAALRAHRLDALVAPVMSPAWPTDPVNGDHFTGAGYGAAAVARYPSITVPMGQVHGLPVGIAFMGTAWSEPRLIALAHASSWRRVRAARRSSGRRSSCRRPDQAAMQPRLRTISIAISSACS